MTVLGPIFGKERDRAKTLKGSLYNTIHRHPYLSVEQIAEHMDMSATYLYRSVTPDQDTDGEKASGVRFMIKKLIPLIQITNDFQALDFIERTLGRVAVPLPPVVADQSGNDIERQALSVGKEFGKLMEEIYESTDETSPAGKNLSAEEKKRIDKVGYKAIQSIMALMIHCEER